MLYGVTWEGQMAALAAWTNGIARCRQDCQQSLNWRSWKRTLLDGIIGGQMGESLRFPSWQVPPVLVKG